MKARIDRLAREVVADGLTGTAAVAARYQASITYKPIALAAIVMVANNSAGVTAPDPKKPSSGGGFGLGKLTSALGGEKQSTQAVASGGSRGVGGDRGAKGGDNPAVVTTTITLAELVAFRNVIAG